MQSAQRQTLYKMWSHMVQSVWPSKIPFPSGGQNMILYGQHQRHGSKVSNQLFNNLALFAIPFMHIDFHHTEQLLICRTGWGMLKSIDVERKHVARHSISSGTGSDSLVGWQWWTMCNESGCIWVWEFDHTNEKTMIRSYQSIVKQERQINLPVCTQDVTVFFGLL